MKDLRLVMDRNVAGANEWISDGQQMAAAEGTGVFESIDYKHEAESAAAVTTVAALRARGSQRADDHTKIDQRLVAMSFDPVRYMREIARGTIDWWTAVGLSIVNAALAVMVLSIGSGSVVMNGLLAFLVLATAMPIALFFEAHHDRAELREGIFLAISILALGASYWLGTIRGIYLSALNAEDVGPATESLRHAATVLRYTLGVLAAVSEVVAGYKFWSARHRLYSAFARAGRQRDALAAELVTLVSAIKATAAEPAIRRQYRIIGARQYLAGHRQHDEHQHLRRAVIGAAIGVGIVLLLMLFAGVASAASAPSGGRITVALIDLTSSTSQELQANISAVDWIIKNTPNKGRIIVLGISDGFGSPRILLDQTVNGKGSFGLELQAARERAAGVWRKATGTLKADYEHTSIIGTIALLPYVVSGPYDLVILSDGRENVLANIANVDEVDVAQAMKRLKAQKAIPDLNGVTVTMAGVSPAGKKPAYFGTLKAFWIEFFAGAGARLVAFKVDRAVAVEQ